MTDSGFTGVEAPPLVRAELFQKVERVLSRGGWGNPDVFLVDVAGRKVVVKDFSPRSFWLRHTVGRWLIRRERAFYRRLAEHPCVPALFEVADDMALALEYRPGEQLSRSLRGVVPAPFLEELRQAVERMHAAGVVHLDLRHRSNVLAGEDGHPVLIDFASAIYAAPDSGLDRWFMPLLRRIDRSALRKWEVRLG